MEDNEMEKNGLTRRTFMKAGAVAGAAAVASSALAACAPAKTRESESGDGGGSAAGTNANGDPLTTLEMDLPNAAPIPPLDPPASWDDEVDVVVVGMGGGGIAASLYCAEEGLKVIALEKESDTGGATQHACGWFALPGGSKAQNELEYAYPEYPFDKKKFVRAIQPYYQYSFVDELLENVAEASGQCIDWMYEHDAPFICMGPILLDARIQNGIQPLGMRNMTKDFTEKAEKAGVDIRRSTACEGFVMDGGRVVGVKSADGKFLKAAKGVILCSGSFGYNKELLAKYCPSAYRTGAVGGPFPFATGEVTRMAIGAGADMTGIDSWCMWEAYPYRGDGAYWTYHWDGSVILCRQPWLTIDKMGNRYGYYSTEAEEYPLSFGGAGDYINAAVQASRMGGGGYCIFDADYEKNIDILTPVSPFLDDRRPISPERLSEAGAVDVDFMKSLCAEDWTEDVKAALERGDIKQADTIEELAEKLELDPEILQESVDKWNETCKKGVDSESIWPYKKEWLIPITKAPYYGAKISGGIGKTFAGPRVNPKLQVIDTDAHVIPGLYAHFMTAGGICGENLWNGTMYNTTILGGNAMSWTSGFMAARSLCENEA